MEIIPFATYLTACTSSPKLAWMDIGDDSANLLKMDAESIGSANVWRWYKYPAIMDIRLESETEINKSFFY